MKYVALLILGFLASNGVAETREQSGPRRFYGQPSGPMSRSMAPAPGSLYSQPSSSPYMGSVPGTQPKTQGYPSPYSQSKNYKKTYSPYEGTKQGAVDVPYSRNRIVRRAEETRSAGTSSHIGSSKNASNTKPKAATQQGVVNSRMVPGYDRPAMEPGEIREAMRGSATRISDAMANQSSEVIEQEVESVRSNVTEMKGRLRNQPVVNQLKLSSIERMYNEGAKDLEEGQRTGEESKMRMGLEKIEKANEHFEEIQ